MPPTVGWIGLGNIGAPMAQRVLEAGFPLRVWARRAGTAQTLVERGALRDESPEALAHESDVLVTIVGGPDDVLDVQRRLLANARSGALVLEMSTASPRTAQALQALAPPGACVLDCPVTGGVAGARQGKLTAFVGGDAHALARARPLLDALCRRVVHCGAAGSGYRMKLVNQVVVAGILLGLGEGAALARDSGFDAPLVGEALGEGTASGLLFESYLPRMLPPGGEITFTLGMLRKDLTLARDQAIGRTEQGFVDFALKIVGEACARHGDGAGVQQLADLR